MNPNPTDRDTYTHRYGLRFSMSDAIVLLLGGALGGWLTAQGIPMAWVVFAVVGHFFLFCNVFMVWQKWELVWAALFVINTATHAALGDLGWHSPMLFQLPVTLIVIACQIRSPWYHGIFAKRLNPRLQDYLNGTL